MLKLDRSKNVLDLLVAIWDLAMEHMFNRYTEAVAMINGGVQWTPYCEKLIKTSKP